MKRRILLVDDDAWWREACAHSLERAGMSVSHADSAMMALDVIDATRPDIIVLDVMLPGANALQLLHELQSYNDTRTLPVILCTSLRELRLHIKELEKYGVYHIFDKASMTPRELVGVTKGIAL